MIVGYKVTPCPRCGAGQAFLHLQSKPPYVVRCGRCGALGPVEGTAEKAVAGWNACRDGGKPESPPNSQKENNTQEAK